MKHALPTTIVLGADHAGFQLKEQLIPWLIQHGNVIEDATPASHVNDDYPPVASEVAKRVAKLPGSFGLLICGTGVGMCIGANRIKGIRAVLGADSATVKMAREHNHANILCLGGRTTTVKNAMKILESFLSTKEDHAIRHARRVRQLS